MVAKTITFSEILHVNDKDEIQMYTFNMATFLVPILEQSRRWKSRLDADTGNDRPIC